MSGMGFVRRGGEVVTLPEPGTPEYEEAEERRAANVATREAEVRAEAEAKYEAHPWVQGAEDGEQADWLEEALNHEAIFNYGANGGHGQWHLYNRKTGLWLPDTTRDIIRIVDEAAQERLRDLLLPGRPSRKRDAEEKVYRKLREKGRIDSAVSMLATRQEYKTDGSIFDRTKHLLGVQNGAVDLRTGELLHGDVLRGEYVSMACNVSWPTKKADLDMAIDVGEQHFYENFILDIMSGDRDVADYLMQVLGYTLFGAAIEEKFWLLVGDGRNGKGTLVKFMHWLLGDYSHFAPASLYIRGKNGDPGADRGRPELLALRGIRFAPTSEPVKGEFNDEMVKAHTGRDPITARQLYSGKMETFDPSHKLFFLAQQAPSVSDVGPSMKARARVIRFEQSYVGREDPGLQSKWQDLGKYILVYLVREATAYWQELGLDREDQMGLALGTGLAEPQKVLDWSQHYIASNDPVGRFITEYCDTGQGERVASARLHEHYLQWHTRTEQEGEALSSTKFSPIVESKGFKKVKERMGQVFHGLSPKSAMALADDG